MQKFYVFWIGNPNVEEMVQENLFFRSLKCVKALAPKLCRCRNLTTMPHYPGSKVVVNNVSIHYEKVGTGNHALLLLPGALGSSRTDFKPQLEQLNRNKFTVVAWDPPGYGFSRPPDRCFSADMLHKDADVAASLMQTLNFASFSVAGWSDGGISALILAARHADKVRKLVVWGANAFISETDIKLYRAVRNIDTWSQRMRDPMIAVYGEPYFRQAQAKWVDTFEQVYAKGGDICKAVLSRIVCPTLIIHGVKDPMVPEEHAMYLHKAIKQSRLETFAEGKHNLHLKFNKEFNNVLENFLEE